MSVVMLVEFVSRGAQTLLIGARDLTVRNLLPAANEHDQTEPCCRQADTPGVGAVTDARTAVEHTDQSRPSPVGHLLAGSPGRRAQTDDKLAAAGRPDLQRRRGG